MFKQKLRAAALAGVLLAGLFCFAGCGAKVKEPLTVTFLDVGKADAAVLINGDHTLVIDAGETDDGDAIVSFLIDAGVKQVDALIVTHFDKDHVGGAAALLAAVPVRRVLVPDYTGDSNEYETFSMMAFGVQVTPEALTKPCAFTLGDCKVTVEPPLDYAIAGTSDDADNELSLITTVTHGGVRLLFTGDAENDRLTEWIANGQVQPCDLIKMPHHGVYCKMQKDLLTAVSPRYAVICDSEKNPAEDKTLSLLAQRGIAVFETKNGNVTAVSDGSALTVTQG